MVTAAPYREQMGTRHAVMEKCLCMKSTREVKGNNTDLTHGELGSQEGQQKPPKPIIQPGRRGTVGVTGRNNLIRVLSADSALSVRNGDPQRASGHSELQKNVPSPEQNHLGLDSRGMDS